MNFSTASKKNREIEQRIQRIVDLSRRRDQILGVAEVDLEALAILAADYEAAHMPRRRWSCGGGWILRERCEGL